MKGRENWKGHELHRLVLESTHNAVSTNTQYSITRNSPAPLPRNSYIDSATPKYGTLGRTNNGVKSDIPRAFRLFRGQQVIYDKLDLPIGEHNCMSVYSDAVVRISRRWSK